MKKITEHFIKNARSTQKPDRLYLTTTTILKISFLLDSWHCSSHLASFALISESERSAACQLRPFSSDTWTKPLCRGSCHWMRGLWT